MLVHYGCGPPKKIPRACWEHAKGIGRTYIVMLLD